MLPRSPSFLLASTLAILALSSASGAVAESGTPAASCADLLLSPLLFYPTSAPAPGAELARRRLEVVAQHQNSLRAAAGLPLVHAPGADAAINLEHPHRAGPGVYASMLATDDPVVWGFHGVAVNMSVLIAGDLVIRANFGDIHGLNYVYQFEGAALKRATPLPLYILERFPDSEATVTLKRVMGPGEARLWQAHDLDTLLKGGHTWDYDRPVMHFSLAPGGRSPWGKTAEPGSVTLEFQVPRSVLADWIRKNELAAGLVDFRSAALPGAAGQALLPDIEFVVKQSCWKELAGYLAH